MFAFKVTATFKDTILVQHYVTKPEADRFIELMQYMFGDHIKLKQECLL